MELRPADLGDAYQTALVLRRARAKEGRSGTGATVWSRRWLRKLRLSPEVENNTTPAIVRYARPYQVPLMGLGLLLAVSNWSGPDPLAVHAAITLLGTGLAYLGLDTLPSFQVRKIYTKAVSEAEVLRLQSAGKKTAKTPVGVGDRLGSRGGSSSAFFDWSNLPWGMMALPPIFEQVFGSGRTTRRADSAETLENDYFELILAALRTPTPDTSLAEELRATLRQIGAAVATVRRSEVIEDTVEAADLVGDAEMLAARARTEGDHYVAASLLRQAQAKIAQAKIVERNVFMRRRTRALSAELRAQIAAAQSSLRNVSSQGVMNATSSGAFRVISDSVRTLATEAESVAMAHDELAAALGEATSRPAATTATQNAQAAGSSVPASASVETGRYNGPSNEKTIVTGRRGW